MSCGSVNCYYSNMLVVVITTDIIQIMDETYIWLRVLLHLNLVIFLHLCEEAQSSVIVALIAHLCCLPYLFLNFLSCLHDKDCQDSRALNSLAFWTVLALV